MSNASSYLLCRSTKYERTKFALLRFPELGWQCGVCVACTSNRRRPGGCVYRWSTAVGWPERQYVWPSAVTQQSSM